MKVYYNEIEPTAVLWLQAAMDEGIISKGVIDTRSIEDVRPDELIGFTQCHFFAGIGGWSIALRLAGWPNDKPVWTGSCPCQPFSTAGKGLGVDDPRHLWPAWFWLIQQCKPNTIFGEQVANAVTKGWLDDVAYDLEAEGYAVGSAVIPACSVGAPHKRDRLWFVATNNMCERIQGERVEPLQRESSFSWCKDVRGVEGLRERSDLPKPTVCHHGDGIPAKLRKAALQGYGIAIVPEVAAEFMNAAKQALQQKGEII